MTSGGIPVPPTPLLVTYADFEEILETSDDPLSAWGPGDFDRYWAGDEFDDRFDATAREDARILNQLWCETDDADLQFFDKLAQRVARMDWSDLPGGDRLIVAFIYAENTGDSGFFSADPTHLTELRQRGWLPDR